MPRDTIGPGYDFANQQNIDHRMDEIALRYGGLEGDDPERDRLLSEFKILMRRLDEIKRLA